MEEKPVVLIQAVKTPDAVTIGKDNCCELGTWLHGEAKTQCSNLASYAPTLSKHAALAEAMPGSGSAFTTVSGEVGIALTRLKKKAL